MSELETRLRNHIAGMAPPYIRGTCEDLLVEAAEEIERLERELELTCDSLEAGNRTGSKLLIDRQDLRKALNVAAAEIVRLEQRYNALADHANKGLDYLHGIQAENVRLERSNELYAIQVALHYIHQKRWLELIAELKNLGRTAMPESDHSGPGQPEPLDGGEGTRAANFKCPQCNGHGFVQYGSDPIICKTCGGNG